MKILPVHSKRHKFPHHMTPPSTPPHSTPGSRLQQTSHNLIIAGRITTAPSPHDPDDNDLPLHPRLPANLPLHLHLLVAPKLSNHITKAAFGFLTVARTRRKRESTFKMSNAKYTPAPTSDPDGSTSYAQPPPAYQAEASAAADTDRLFGGGAPRSSQDDDIPDDFKFGGSVAEATTDIRNQFIRKVYAILTVQLIATGIVSALSFWSQSYKTWIQSHPGLVWVSLIGSIVFMLLTYWKRKSYPTNLLFLGLFTLTEAYTISVIVSFYKTEIVLNAVVLTAGIFVFLTLFACQTKYDFTSWMPYLFGALWGLVLFGFMAAFFPYSSTGELVYGGLAALIFSAYILVDTQLVMRKHHVEEEIAAAISLYLDIINLFLAILRILNSQQNN
ncbi:hypothetical protein CcaCcLH18_07355 [Colletotrichum camelliae]|nr:hypothetical protein CcaCcLH18_07355 [Colletotrichum camelliae]